MIRVTMIGDINISAAATWHGRSPDQRRFSVKKFSWRKAALVAAVVPMMALSACSSSGGRPAENANAGAGGQAASTPRIKVALITHAAPGDTF